MRPQVSHIFIARQVALTSESLDIVAVSTRALIRNLCDTDSQRTTQYDNSSHADLEKAISGDLVKLKLSVARLCSTGDVGDSISLFSPSLFNELNSDNIEQISDYAIRSGFKYVVRASLKPSPFSSLTRLGYTGSAPDASVSQVAVHFLHQLLLAMCTVPELAPLFQYRKVTVFEDNMILRRWSALKSGFNWVKSESLSIEDVSEDFRELSIWEQGDWGSIQLATGAPASRILRWIHMRLIEVVCPWETNLAKSPISLLIDILENASVRPDVKELLSNLETLVENIPTSQPVQRAHIARSLSSVSGQLLRSVGESETASTIVTEDVGIKTNPPPLSLAVQPAQLEPLRKFVFRSHQYKVVVASFVSRHGTGGRVDNAREFFQWCAIDPRIQERLSSARLQDSQVHSDSIPTDLVFAKVGETSAPPTLSMIYQRTGNKHYSDQVVANQFADGLGGLIARYSALDAGPNTGISLGIRTWLADRFADNVQLLEFIPGAEGNSAQFLSQGHLPKIHWSKNASTPNLSFDDLSIQHDSQNNVLEFILQDQHCAPIYLGLLPYWQVEGAEGIACLLMNPWMDRTPTSLLSHPLYRQTIAEKSIHIPRRTVNGIVLVRETWHFPTESIPVRKRQETDGQFLLRFEQWRTETDLPQEAFFLPLSPGEFHKPFWVDFHSLIALEVMEAEIRRSHTVRFQEVLPRREESNPATEFISLIGWERS